MNSRDCHRIFEAYYPGMVGIEELMKFYQVATDSEQDILKTYMRNKRIKDAFRLITKVTGMRMKESSQMNSFKSYIQ